jgi:hypothetical protein
MPDFARRVAGAAVKAAIGYDTRAETSSHGEENHIPGAAPRTETVLGYGTRVGIVFQTAGYAKFRFENGRNGDVHPGPEIRRRANHAGCGIQRSAAAYPDGPERGAIETARAKRFIDAADDHIDGALGAFGG